MGLAVFAHLCSADFVETIFYLKKFSTFLYSSEVFWSCSECFESTPTEDAIAMLAGKRGSVQGSEDLESIWTKSGQQAPAHNRPIQRNPPFLGKILLPVSAARPFTWIRTGNEAQWHFAQRELRPGNSSAFELGPALSLSSDLNCLKFTATLMEASG